MNWQIRADDVSGQPIVFDNFGTMLLDAAKAEGERPHREFAKRRVADR
jgi:hypothetical protein